jgi:Protein of unknown function (DUF2846)
MHRRSLFVLTALSVLVGCTAAPIIDGPVFSALEPPGDGYARVYLFRPGFSRVSRGDAPVLLINNTEVGNLLYESYLPFAFGPGTHRISLKPTLMDSSAWKIDYDFSVQPGRTYYLAVWNTVDAAGGIPVWIPLLPIPGTHLILVQEGRIGGNTGVRLEFVAEEEALPVLREMRLIKPKQDVFLRP